MTTTPIHRWLRLSGLCVALACVSRGASQPAAKVAADRQYDRPWDFTPAPGASENSGSTGPRLGPGTQFTLEFGPEEHARFQGRVQYMLSGDVVVSPQIFEPVTGWFQAGQIGFAIGLADPAHPSPLGARRAARGYHSGHKRRRGRRCIVVPRARKPLRTTSQVGRRVIPRCGHHIARPLPPHARRTCRPAEAARRTPSRRPPEGRTSPDGTTGGGQQAARRDCQIDLGEGAPRVGARGIRARHSAGAAAIKTSTMSARRSINTFGPSGHQPWCRSSACARARAPNRSSPPPKTIIHSGSR